MVIKNESFFFFLFRLIDYKESLILIVSKRIYFDSSRANGNNLNKKYLYLLLRFEIF